MVGQFLMPLYKYLNLCVGCSTSLTNHLAMQFYPARFVKRPGKQRPHPKTNSTIGYHHADTRVVLDVFCSLTAKERLNKASI